MTITIHNQCNVPVEVDVMRHDNGQQGSATRVDAGTKPLSLHINHQGNVYQNHDIDKIRVTFLTEQGKQIIRTKQHQLTQADRNAKHLHFVITSEYDLPPPTYTRH